MEARKGRQRDLGNSGPAVSAKEGFRQVLGMIFTVTYWGYEGLEKKGLAAGALMLVLFCLVYAAVAYLFLARRDGPYGQHRMPDLLGGARGLASAVARRVRR